MEQEIRSYTQSDIALIGALEKLGRYVGWEFSRPIDPAAEDAPIWQAARELDSSCSQRFSEKHYLDDYWLLMGSELGSWAGPVHQHDEAGVPLCLDVWPRQLLPEDSDSPYWCACCAAIEQVLVDFEWE